MRSTEDARALLRAQLERRLAVVAPNGAPAEAHSATIPRRRGERSFPLSFQQELLWLLDRTTPDLNAYNVMRTARLQGPLDASALQRAVDAVVERHEILRTTYTLVGGQPRQVVQPARTVPLAWLPVEAAAPDERIAEAARTVAALIRRPFDLGADLQLRATVLELRADDHVLLLESHHIAADAWSRGILLDELGRLYDGYRSANPVALPPLAVQYGDFAAWQRETFAGPVLEASIAYWRTRLAGVPAMIDLPTDYPHPSIARFDGGVQRIVFDAALLEGLRNIGKQHRATLFMVLLAAFGILLGRYAGQEDILVGSPIAGRGREEIDGLIGYFANTLVLRVALGGNPTFPELLARVRESALGAYGHQDIPYEKLVMELAPPSVNGRTALVQVMFTLQDSEAKQLHLGGTTLVPFGSGRDSSKFDLALFAQERPDGLAAQLHYRTQLFDPATIDRILANFGTLLASIVRDPSARLSALSVLSPAERALVIARNATAAAFPSTATVDELIAQQAARTPEATAVEWSDGDETVARLTYAELDERAARLASYLRELGVGPEVGVGLCIFRSADLIVAMLGVLKAGGYYLPLDPENPPERLAWMLADSAVPVLLTAGNVPNLPFPAAAGPKIVRLDNDRPLIEAAACTPGGDAPRATADGLAYVMYTSGSTGRPKGVMIAHRSVVNCVTWMQSTYPVCADDGVLHKAPASFDASVWEVFFPLVAGARVVLAPPGNHGDAFDVLATLDRHAVTSALFVPSQLRIILETTGARGANSFGRFRRLFIGGERLSPELLDRFFAACPRVPVTNLYGPTEATVYATHWPIDAQRWRSGATVSLGGPVANAGVYVLDGSDEPAPVGVAGELCIGGTGLARGYLNRPELTAERFRAHRQLGLPGQRLYRTGDLARYRADGTLEYLGRSDTQVKLRGFRVELGEIESTLTTQPEVESAIVLLRGDDTDQRLVAYCIPTPLASGVTALDRTLAARLRGLLPEYMIPAAFVWVDVWPLMANGKLDRATLAAFEVAPAVSPRSFVDPRTPTEEQLAGIWMQVMRRERVGVDDNFFDLGGHSILAMRIVSRVQEVFGIRVALATMFDRPTIAQMADFVDDARRAPSTPAAPAITRAARGTLRRPVPGPTPS